ncbi:hypothetical protein DPMN_024923 [Dreissena polymorpha]|uniref:Uncharacterized protein n=1 Tax=Dreissena polymorpha TaxID=45954 RepID=A0A9D4LPT9_DREPO|nr:hypothetical protein DPMN_024923 [Dreissena polymorpha]
MLQGPSAPNPSIRIYNMGPIYSLKHIPVTSSTAHSCQIRQGRLQDDKQRKPNDRLPGMAIPANPAY